MNTVCDGKDERMSAVRYSLVIPVYNEVQRLRQNVPVIFDFFRSSGVSFEIIFVNDGSLDDTHNVLLEFNRTYPFRLISYERNRGKGYAVREGALASTGGWILFFDIDLATPLEEFRHFLSFRDSRDDVIIGSRRLADSHIRKNESALRVALGSGFSLLSRFLVPAVSDFTCGFKCFSRRAAMSIFPLARINRWAFDTEILYIARLQGFSTREMPVMWSHNEDSRVHVLSDVLTSARDLLRIHVNAWRGRYNMYDAARMPVAFNEARSR